MDEFNISGRLVQIHKDMVELSLRIDALQVALKQAQDQHYRLDGARIILEQLAAEGTMI